MPLFSKIGLGMAKSYFPQANHSASQSFAHIFKGGLAMAKSHFSQSLAQGVFSSLAGCKAEIKHV